MTLLNKLYNQKNIKKHLSKALFVLKRRPSTIPITERNNIVGKAIFMISADFELGWGWRYSRNSENPIEMAHRSRNNFPFLIELFNDYNLPITWGIVGHLFLHSCNKDSHAWMRRIPYFRNKNWIYNKGDWFDADPCTCWEEANGWYAPDLIQMILNSKVAHEIGCHTFSHIDFSYKNCPQAVAEDELKACTDVAREWGIEMKSLIFAGGTYGNYEVLKKYGFIAYRKTLKYELACPQIDENGLVVIPASVGLENNQLGWSAEYLITRYKKYIDKAIKTGMICHFWFHPSMDEWFLHNVFPDLLQYAAELRDRHLIQIETMGHIAEFILNDSKVK